MKIMIAGMSSTGIFLVNIVSANTDYDVTVIDNSKAEIDKVTDLYNVSGVCGNCSSREILMKAGADTADIIIALTPIDEINIVCCMMAKDCGTRYSAAMVHCPELVGDTEYFKKLASVDYIVNPRHAAAEEIELQIGLPGKIKTDAVFEDRAVMLKTTVETGGILDGKSMMDVKQYFDNKMLIGAVRRGKDIFIPNGSSSLAGGDEIEIISEKDFAPEIIKKLGFPAPSTNRILLIGCGTTGYYLTESLVKKKKNLRIIESDMTRCRSLSELFPSVEISCITDADTFMNQDMKNVDVCISLTDEDDRNLVNSLYAWSCGVHSIIARINSVQYDKQLDKVDTQINVSPTIIAAERILGFVRNVAFYNEKGDDIGQLRLISNSGAEAIEFMAYDTCKVLDVPFASPAFKLNKDVLIAIIIRDGETIIPDGQSVIKSGDRVIVVTKTGGQYNTLNDIFR